MAKAARWGTDTRSLLGLVGAELLGVWGFLRVDRTASEEDQLAQLVRKYEFIAANPWPAFEPWREILLPGQKQTRPTVHRAVEYEHWKPDRSPDPARLHTHGLPAPDLRRRVTSGAGVRPQGAALRAERNEVCHEYRLTPCWCSGSR